MFKSIIGSVVLSSLLSAAGSMDSVYGVYQSKNGSIVEIKNEKDEAERDISFSFKNAQCHIKEFYYKDFMKGNQYKIEDNQGYGTILYFKATFNKKTMKLVITRKFLSDSGCSEEGVAESLSGSYTKVK